MLKLFLDLTGFRSRGPKPSQSGKAPGRPGAYNGSGLQIEELEQRLAPALGLGNGVLTQSSLPSVLQPVPVMPVSAMTVTSQSPGGSAARTSPVPNLVPTISASPSSILAGARAEFEIAVTNKGSGEAVDVALTDHLPSGSSNGDRWALDSGDSHFTLADTGGTQTLTLLPHTSIAPDATIMAVVGAPTSLADANPSTLLIGSLHTDLTVTAANQPSPKSATATIAVLSTQPDLSGQMFNLLVSQIQTADENLGPFAPGAAKALAPQELAQKALGGGWVQSGMTFKQIFSVFKETNLSLNTAQLDYLKTALDSDAQWLLPAQSSFQFTVVTGTDSKGLPYLDLGKTTLTTSVTFEGAQIFDDKPLKVGDLSIKEFSGTLTGAINESNSLGSGRLYTTHSPPRAPAPVVTENLQFDLSFTARIPVVNLDLKWKAQILLHPDGSHAVTFSLPDTASITIPLTKQLNDALTTPFTSPVDQYFGFTLPGFLETLSQLEGQNIQPTKVNSSIVITLDLGQLNQIIQGQHHILIAAAEFDSSYSWGYSKAYPLGSPAWIGPFLVSADIKVSASWGYQFVLKGDLYTDALIVDPSSHFVIQGSGSAALEVRALVVGIIGPEIDIGLSLVAALSVTPSDHAVNVQFTASVNAFISVDISIVGIVKVQIASWTFSLLSIGTSTTEPAPFGTAPTGNGPFPGLSQAEFDKLLSQLPSDQLAGLLTPRWLSTLTYTELKELLANPNLTPAQSALIDGYRIARLVNGPVEERLALLTPSILNTMSSTDLTMLASSTTGFGPFGPGAQIQSYYWSALMREMGKLKNMPGAWLLSDPNLPFGLSVGSNYLRLVRLFVGTPQDIAPPGPYTDSTNVVTLASLSAMCSDDLAVLLTNQQLTPDQRSMILQLYSAALVRERQ